MLKFLDIFLTRDTMPLCRNNQDDRYLDVNARIPHDWSQDVSGSMISHVESPYRYTCNRYNVPTMIAIHISSLIGECDIDIHLVQGFDAH